MNRFLKHLTTVPTFEWLSPFFNETQYWTSNSSVRQKAAHLPDGIKNEDTPFNKNSVTLATPSSHRPNPANSFTKNNDFKKSKKLSDKLTKQQTPKESPQEKQPAFHVEEEIWFKKSVVVKKNSKKRKTQQSNVIASNCPPIQTLASTHPTQNISFKKQVSKSRWWSTLFRR